MRLDDATLTKLERLHQAAERINANLVELEVDSGRKLLEASSLEGESAARWSAAGSALTELWRRQSLLEDLLQRADRARASRHTDELRVLLTGPSIELASADVPLAQRHLLGSAETAERCSPDELLAAMSDAFDEVKLVVYAIGGAWETLVPKVDAARRLQEEATRLAEEVGESSAHELDRASQALAQLAAAVTNDPLSVTAADTDKLTGSLRVVRDELEATAALKRGFDRRILAAHELLGGLRTRVEEGQSAHAELVVKIAAPSLPPAPEMPSAPAAELTEIEELARRGRWREANRRLERWTARTQGLLEDAARAVDANRAPIEARNQFRALLEAYQVKAKRLGRLEDPRLTEIFSTAQAALFTAPTDLATAAQLVRSYQEALNESRPAQEAMP
jgi:hypothetical protein